MYGRHAVQSRPKEANCYRPANDTRDATSNSQPDRGPNGRADDVPRGSSEGDPYGHLAPPVRGPPSGETVYADSSQRHGDDPETCDEQRLEPFRPRPRRQKIMKGL